MSGLLKSARRAAETAAPALKLGRLAMYAITVVVGLGLIWVAVDWLIMRPIRANSQAAQSKVDATLGAATGKIATDAIPQINEANRQKVEVDVLIQKGQIDVRSQADAGASLNGVSDAVLRSVCLLDRAPGADGTEQPVHVDPACERFAGRDSGGGQEPD
ncbi:MAG: hypothetical protein ACKVOB_13425 [Sphingomonas sp.]